MVAAVLGVPAKAGWNKLTPSFTRVYEGEIGKSPVRLTLTKKGQRLTGSYIYTRVGKPLRLHGKIDGDGVFQLDEFDAGGKNTGSFKAEFDGPTRLDGTWRKPGEEEGVFFFAYEAFRKPSDATGPFTGHWGSPNAAGPQGFSLELYQRGSRIEGFYHAITRNATRLDTDSVVEGTVAGRTARVRWTSGYSGVKGSAVLRLERGNRLRWQIPNPPSGEYWAPRDTTLKRDRGTAISR
jgi:hypothetical protein